MHSRKSLLFNNTSVWVKKEGDPAIDVTMGGSFDGAEICELVGVYILNVLNKKYGKARMVLYRDDGLACFEIRNDVIKFFKQEFDLTATTKQTSKLSIF